MSLLDRYECATCGGLTGYPGLRTSQDELRKDLACSCPTNAELDAQDALLSLTVAQLTCERPPLEQLTETLPDPLKRIAA